MLRNTFLGLAIVVLGMSQSAQGALIINITQSGDDVLMSGSGTVNLTDLTKVGDANVDSMLDAEWGIALCGGTTPAATDYYSGLTGPAEFTSVIPGIDAYASSSTGDLMGIYGYFPWVYVPDGYVSGTELSGSSTFENETISSLGLEQGAFVWTWGEGANADSLTLNITPEPASMSLLGLGALVLLKRRKRQ